MVNYATRDSYRSIFSEPGQSYGRKATKKDKKLVSVEDPVFVDLLSDYGCKLVMTAAGAEKEVAHLLNSLLKPTKHIDNITLKTVEQQSELHDGKKSLYDICCEQKDKELFVIEMQNRDQSFFDRRVNFYGARSIANQVAAGDKEYFYLPVTLISFVNFEIKGLSTAKYHHVLDCGHWEDEPLDFKEKFKAHIFELRKYPRKQLDQLETDEDMWIYLIRNMGKLKEIPALFDNETFRPVFERARFKSLKKGEQMEYRTAMDASKDEANRLHFREEKGMRKGIRKGIRKGREEMKKKIAEVKRNMIAKALQANLDVKMIAELADADPIEIEAVRSKMALS